MEVGSSATPHIEDTLEAARERLGRIAPARSSCRPEVRRETRSRRRPLRRSSRPCGQEPNPGARPHPAGFADEVGPCRDDDHRRHGTTTLFAALNILGRHRQEHTAPSPLRVHPLPQHDRGAGPVGKVTTPIVDNYATHKHPKARNGWPGIPNWTFHFTPDFRILAQSG
jgi:hypothetical protein